MSRVFRIDEKKVGYISHKDPLSGSSRAIIWMGSKLSRFLKERGAYIESSISDLKRKPFSGEKIDFGDVYCGYNGKEEEFKFKGETFPNRFILMCYTTEEEVGIIYKTEKEREFLESIVRRANENRLPLRKFLEGNEIIEQTIGKI